METPIVIGSVLVDSVVVAPIDCPAEVVNLPGWLFKLTDGEYRACSKDHVACGSTNAPDGRRMSINVERVSGNLMIQRYVEQSAAAHRLVLRSQSDAFSEAGVTKLEITWEPAIRARGGQGCELSNRILVAATAEFVDLLLAAGITDPCRVRPLMQLNALNHTLGETPLFAADIQRKAQCDFGSFP